MSQKPSTTQGLLVIFLGPHELSVLAPYKNRLGKDTSSISSWPKTALKRLPTQVSHPTAIHPSVNKEVDFYDINKKETCNKI